VDAKTVATFLRRGFLVVTKLWPEWGEGDLSLESAGVKSRTSLLAASLWALYRVAAFALVSRIII
jgi:hypothetical protein